MHGMAFRMNEKWFTSRWGEGQEGVKKPRRFMEGGGVRKGGEGFHVPRFNRDTEMRNLWR